MVSYLVLVVNIISLGILGMSYMISSDLIDILIPIGAALGNTHPDTTFILDALIFFFKWLPVWIIIGVIMFNYVMAQKPSRAW